MSRIFISYSHRGNGPKWKAALLCALHVFERHHLLDVWQDGKIRISSFWNDDIVRAMANAKLAVVLLTKEALESEYILKTEFPFLRERQQRDGLSVFPVVCEPCDWRAHDWLRSTQAPNESNPLSQLSGLDQEIVFRKLATDIAEELSRVALAELSKPDQPLSPKHVCLDKFPLTRSGGTREERLIGREQELALLDLAFAQPHTAIVSLVAWGGVGKTMLVQHWLQRLERKGWFGARRVYAWSFYSQGTKEDRQASEDTFLAHALEWFGVQCEPTLSPWDKGRLLADAVARERTLLILDGIEPLQYPPGPMGGQLRAPGVQSLLKQLARKANSVKPETDGGLCLVTTREPLTDLADFQRREGSAWGSVLRVDLGNLTDEAGAALLHHAGAKRAGAAEIKPDDIELLAASREVDSHALTLNLLGRFLARAHGGDIRRRDLVKFEEADRKEQGGTTFKMLAAFESWFARSGDFGARQLSVLRMLGLFDRPADAGCIGALRKPPVIAGLTEPLFTARLDSTGQASVQPLLEEDWNTAISFVADFGLVVKQPWERRRIVGYSEEDAIKVKVYRSVDAYPELGDPKPFETVHSTFEADYSLDSHPLIREFFATQMRRTAAIAFKAAHLRLFDYLRNSVPYWPEGFDGLEPLYQAVAHGCRIGMYQLVLDEVCMDRIWRRNESYTMRKLGAFGSDLGAIVCLFERPWSPQIKLSETSQAFVLNCAAICLRAMGRLTEVHELLRTALAFNVERSKWKNAATVSNNMSELDLGLGNITDALSEAQQSVMFAERSADTHSRSSYRTTFGEILNRAGQLEVAGIELRKAEAIYQEDQFGHPLLYGLSGLRLCDFLLINAECAAWRCSIQVETKISNPTILLSSCVSVENRGIQTLRASEQDSDASILTVALDHLILGRATFYRTLLERSGLARRPEGKYSEAEILGMKTALAFAFEHLVAATHGVRQAGQHEFIVHSLLPRAWLRFLDGDAAGARTDLDEAWDIAERGPMRLHLADIHLHRARLFFREQPYPWKSAQDDLATAEKLINDCGYHRRDEELADAKRAILGQ